MVVGFNHNVVYKGDVFHVQTEDSGVGNPSITTLLYRGGSILASKKTSYADILKIDDLEQVVEDLMKEQHKEMLRRLKSGEFDDRAFPGQASAAAVPAAPRANVPPPAARTEAAPRPNPPPAPPATPPRPQKSLDEVILNYLLVDGDK